MIEDKHAALKSLICDAEVADELSGAFKVIPSDTSALAYPLTGSPVRWSGHTIGTALRDVRRSVLARRLMLIR